MNTELKKLIDTINVSFLRDEHKYALINTLTTYGITDQFFADANAVFLKEIGARGDAYIEAGSDFDLNIQRLRAKFDNRKAQLDKELDAFIANVDPANIEDKEKAFSSYYRSLNDAQTELEHDIKAFCSQFISKSLEKIF